MTKKTKTLISLLTLGVAFVFAGPGGLIVTGLLILVIVS